MPSTAQLSSQARAAGARLCKAAKNTTLHFCVLSATAASQRLDVCKPGPPAVGGYRLSRLSCTRGYGTSVPFLTLRDCAAARAAQSSIKGEEGKKKARLPKSRARALRVCHAILLPGLALRVHRESCCERRGLFCRTAGGGRRVSGADTFLH